MQGEETSEVPSAEPEAVNEEVQQEKDCEVDKPEEEEEEQVVVSFVDRKHEDMVQGHKCYRRVRELTINYDDAEHLVVIKKLGMGQKAALMSSGLDIRYNIVGGKKEVDTHIDISKNATKALMKCVIKAPFPITEEFIDEYLDSNVGSAILHHCSEFNNLTEKKRKN